MRSLPLQNPALYKHSWQHEAGSDASTAGTPQEHRKAMASTIQRQEYGLVSLRQHTLDFRETFMDLCRMRQGRLQSWQSS